MNFGHCFCKQFQAEPDVSPLIYGVTVLQISVKKFDMKQHHAKSLLHADVFSTSGSPGICI